MKGISVKVNIGLGDALQFSSVPENYFRATGEKLLDVTKPWFFDHNPYVVRDDSIKPEKVIEMWNYSPKQYDWPKIRPEEVYLSNAEIHAAVWGVPTVLNRPRLYKYEEYPFENREMILLHYAGVSHGNMPDDVLKHVIKKYGPSKKLYLIGRNPLRIDLPHIETPSYWDLAATIAGARMLIGVDSGPSWIAACYPDVVVKKLRTKPTPEHFKDWVPLSSKNIHSHWDDRCHHIFNPTTEDVGFTSAYTKI